MVFRRLLFSGLHRWASPFPGYSDQLKVKAHDPGQSQSAHTIILSSLSLSTVPVAQVGLLRLNSTISVTLIKESF